MPSIRPKQKSPSATKVRRRSSPKPQPSQSASQQDLLYRRIRHEIIDDLDEEVEMERADWDPKSAGNASSAAGTTTERAQRDFYFKELYRLQTQLVSLQ